MGNHFSKEVHWFKDTLLTEFAVVVAVEDIGVEATELGIDEVEDFYIPNELFDDLPETLVYEIMIVDDELANVWVGTIAFYPDLPDWCLQAITKNGELVYRNLLPIVQ